MTQDTIESRLSRLEEQVSLLMRARTNVDDPGPDEWEQTVGMFRGDPIVGEMIEGARRIREEDRRRARRGAGARPGMIVLDSGNLIGGWAHSRDLMYSSKLFTSYNTEAKIFETLELAQACGINTIQLDPACWAAVTKYNRQRSDKIQTMVCVTLHENKTEMSDTIKRQVDLGATLIYSHGGVTDTYMMNGGKIDAIEDVQKCAHRKRPWRA